MWRGFFHPSTVEVVVQIMKRMRAGAPTTLRLRCRIEGSEGFAVATCSRLNVRVFRSVGIGSGGAEIHSTQRAGAGDVEEPGVYTFRVELVIARKHTDVLTFCEIIRAHGASKTVVRISQWVVGVVGMRLASGDFGCNNVIASFG